MIPLQIIVALLVVFSILLYWSFVFVIIYHLARFGIGTQPKRLAAIFLFGSVILFGIFITSFASINLSAIKLPW